MVVRNCIIVFVLTLLYSILRYNVFGSIPVSDIPTIIINKSLSFSLIMFLLLAIVSRINNKVGHHKKYMQFTKAFVILHVLLSLSLLSEKYYPKLYESSRLTISGGTSILFGVVALLSYFFRRNKITILVFYMLIMLHLIFLGYRGWFYFGKWNGMMPPISLLCTIIIFVTMVLVVTSKKNKNELKINAKKIEQNNKENT